MGLERIGSGLTHRSRMYQNPPSDPQFPLVYSLVAVSQALDYSLLLPSESKESSAEVRELTFADIDTFWATF